VMVRFTPDATKLLRSSEMTRWAMSGRKQVQQCWCSRANLFDHLVGKREEILRHFEAKRLGRI
jgi:hypothetical protein